MDWSTFIASVLGSTVLVAILVWLSKTWIGTRIKASIENEYNLKLESHKASLQQETNTAIQQMKSEYQNSVDSIAADKVLFLQLLSKLPSTGAIGFLRENNFAGFSFRRTNLDQIYDYCAMWAGPEHEFLDDQLEAKRIAMTQSIQDFLDYIAVNTWPVAVNTELQTVPPEWELDEPDRFNEIVSRIHELANQITEQHSDLVRCGKQKLKVSQA